MKKVLFINGSPRKNGNTYLALNEMVRVFEENGVEAEIIQVGNLDIRGCMSCGYCRKNAKCVFDDIVNETAEKLKNSDGLVLGAPVYYSSPNGTMISFLDRLFYSARWDKRSIVGAAVTVCRRGGNSASFDVLNKYFSISEMPIATSHYWNMVYGCEEGEAALDAEGLQTMRSLAKNMVFLMNGVELAKEKYGLPEKEDRSNTNFIR